MTLHYQKFNQSQFLVVDNSPRPKRKSEIRSLLDATTTVADNNKPQWMMFQAHHHAPQHHAGEENINNNTVQKNAHFCIRNVASTINRKVHT